MKKIGQGNQGIVYKIISDDLKKYVVKEIKADAAFLKELYDIRQNRHEKMVLLHDYREYNYYMYGIMEYMNGGTLKEMLFFIKKINEDYLKLFIFQILEGLDFMHKNHNDLYRDLKPSKNMINLNGEMKLIDYGVTHKYLKTHNQKSPIVKDLKYIAPERFKKTKFCAKSDIWSLGVIAYKCFYGKDPLQYKNQFDLIEKMKKFSMPADAPPKFADFIYSCLKFSTEERLSADQLLNHEWLNMAVKIKKDSKIEIFCKKYFINYFKKYRLERNLKGEFIRKKYI